MSQGCADTNGGSCVDEPWPSSPKSSNRPPCEAFTTWESAQSKASDTLASKAARSICMASKAPALISASTARLLTRLQSTREQKSKKLRNKPPLWRASMIASMAPWPVPLMAPKP